MQPPDDRKQKAENQVSVIEQPPGKSKVPTRCGEDVYAAIGKRRAVNKNKSLKSLRSLACSNASVIFVWLYNFLPAQWSEGERFRSMHGSRMLFRRQPEAQVAGKVSGQISVSPGSGRARPRTRRRTARSRSHDPVDVILVVHGSPAFAALDG